MGKRHNTTTININHRNNYGFFNLAFDFIMTFLTGGLWLIWVAVRYLRTH